MMGPGQQVRAHQQASGFPKRCWKEGPTYNRLVSGVLHLLRNTKKVPTYTHPLLALSRTPCAGRALDVYYIKLSCKGEDFLTIFNSWCLQCAVPGRC